MSDEANEANTTAPPVLRTLYHHNGETLERVVTVRIRPAVLVCELEDGKTVEVEESTVNRIEPALTETPERAAHASEPLWKRILRRLD